jgi:hypothetical protein
MDFSYNTPDTLVTVSGTLLGTISSYLTLPDLLARMAPLCRTLHARYFNSSESQLIWKVIVMMWTTSESYNLHHMQPRLSESLVPPRALRVFPPALYRQIAQEGYLENGAFIMEMWKKLYLEGRATAAQHMEIEGVRASSQDFNQSIYRTLDRRSLDYFWSSNGSETPEAEEYLIFKVAPKSMSELNPRALITSVVIGVF